MCQDTMYELIQAFTPLFKKYANLLNFDDAFFELQAYFIDLISTLNIDRLNNQSDGALVNYINKSIYNQYVKLAQEQERRQNKFSFMADTEEGLKNLLSSRDDYWELQKEDLKRVLSSYEYEVINLIFYYGYTVKEIASSLKVSVQAVNQCKLRALSKLKRNLKYY